MSYNGSGTFNINSSGQPVVTGTVISSTVFNALTADLGTGLSTAITKDGQTTATAKIPFALGISINGATSGVTSLLATDAVTATITLPSSTATLATLGANTFTGNQSITGTLGVTGTLTASDTFINTVNTTALFGVLTSANGSRFVIQSDMSGANAPEIINTHSTSSGDYALKFYRNTSSLVGSIQTTNVATSYVTSSDYRLKENVQPMTGALATVAALKPVSFNWKVDGSDGQGFIAHELAEVVPDCVTGEKDAVNENGSIKPQGIDTSFLVATLTAAIQELAAKVAALEAK